ncbi:MAG: hypothetical protein QN173_01195 [Armatimonadota bacterium]|nr:hypothetical protein [Armatimonadota bacterium]MDR7401468.1 hypothetical protein [Armatimonadota bacterium]MDR7437196.1 hypothetical protein [Armatimonadota bacterium]MDR7472996.1 hypothetical protein [Armatimonadota bacterium]MDR7506206.1 hypothetical protein [Armatimonadota bacterium]
MKRLSVVALTVTAALAVGAWMPAPAAAQLATQRGNSVSARLVSIGGTTDWVLGVAYRINPTLDAAFAYSTIPPFDSEIDLGVRLHFPARTPGIDPFVGAGIAFTNVAGTSGSGVFIQGGAALTLAPRWQGFAAIHYVSSSGLTATIYDVGVQYQFTSQTSGVLGFTGSSAGNGVYVGVSFNLR